MKFYVEMHAGRIGEIKKRLTKDNTWRIMFNNDMLKEDALFPDYNELSQFKQMDKVLQEKQGDYQFGKNRVQIVPFVYRISKPNIPQEKDVQMALVSGDDEQHNTLVVDLEGHVKLERFLGADNFAPRAVRLEAFVAGNGYVGRDAASDNGHVKSSYEMLLEGWTTHLKTGRLDIFQDYSTNPIDKSITEINDLTKNLAYKI